MKLDGYSKTILTIIAACLVILVLQNASLLPIANANNNNLPGKEFAKLPVNEDGTVNVRVESMASDVMDVNIVALDGSSVRKGLPITNSRRALNINIEEVDGYKTYGELPVKIKD